MIQPFPFMDQIPFVPKHPAKYSLELYPAMAKLLAHGGMPARILDPFAGVGGIFRLQAWFPDAEIHGVEIEPEWAQADPRITLGSALDLPWPDGYFDAICTSPTYGNRMADQYVPDGPSPWHWHTYAWYLGRKLSEGNSGALQWGQKYCDFHCRAWMEARRVLSPFGKLVLNIRDHIRDEKRQRVTLWHILCLQRLGFRLVRHERVSTPGNRDGENQELRMEYESVILFEI